MNNISTETGKDGRKEESSVQYVIENLESKQENLESDRCRSKLDPEKNLISNVRRSRVSSSPRELLVPNSIPKHITTLDEKYVLRCLELIRNCALKVAARNLASKVDILPHDPSFLAEFSTRGSYDMARLALECPIAVGTEFVVNSTGDWAIGTVTGSQSMINILKSPLLQRYGSTDFDANFGKTGLIDVTDPVYSGFLVSKQESDATLSHKPQISDPVHKRLVSISSTSSSYSDKSSSSAPAATFQGMLQCTWKNGLPHHVFTVDDKREVYVADLSKVESLDDKVLDYVYAFHLRKRGRKDCDIDELDMENVGKMRVSNSVTFGSDNTEVRETRFILYVSSDDPMAEQQNSNHTPRKNKRLTKKVVDVFRSSTYHKQRSSSKFERSSAIFEDSPWEPSEDVRNRLDPSGTGGEKSYFPNLELAAIIVKDVFKNREEADIGGWGLKFLKKSRNDATAVVSEDRECSTSTNIIIPAGLHGGPRTRVGGPSGLTERWSSGGQCDCGGWDIGCPLTVLDVQSSTTDSSSQVDGSGECESIDLFVQGSKRDVAPMLKMANIHEGLYYIHFQSTLTSLQSFAIAAAVIHSRSPLLRSKVYRR